MWLSFEYVGMQLASLGAVLVFVSRSLKSGVNPATLVEKEHPAGRCTPGYVNHADSGVKAGSLIYRRGVLALQMTLICH